MENKKLINELNEWMTIDNELDSSRELERILDMVAVLFGNKTFSQKNIGRKISEILNILVSSAIVSAERGDNNAKKNLEEIKGILNG